MNRSARLALTAGALGVIARLAWQNDTRRRSMYLATRGSMTFPAPGKPCDGEPLSLLEKFMWAEAGLSLDLTPSDDGDSE